jgi:hypothetical protein
MLVNKRREGAGRSRSIGTATVIAMLMLPACQGRTQQLEKELMDLGVELEVVRQELEETREKLTAIEQRTRTEQRAAGDTGEILIENPTLGLTCSEAGCRYEAKVEVTSRAEKPLLFYKSRVLLRKSSSESFVLQLEGARGGIEPGQRLVLAGSVATSREDAQEITIAEVVLEVNNNLRQYRMRLSVPPYPAHGDS